jgi:ankyrin repeat protein
LGSNTSLPFNFFAFGLAWVALLPACQNADDIIQAARFGDLEKLSDCIESGIPVDHADPVGETALFHIVGMGSDEGFRLLMANGADIRLRDRQGDTTLHKAMTFDQRGLASHLIERGLDINATNKVGATALHYAVRSANLRMVNFLVERGAKIGVRDAKGSTPAEVAQAMSGQEGLSGTMGRTISKKQMHKIISALTKSTTDK